jgi:uncharacterized protein (DUF486 family)
VAGNGTGDSVMTLPRLKVLQEGITLTIFVPFVILYMNQ